ncbi:cyclic nucleotide-binding domain-containing protein [Alsobacter sp. KACC 23698]|uniref:Cyclic nucleotide-binding domain-containing protein n=1 Tax=Alsobacter sp. KACC 23698 TaxID=3149229 RepID=A0AAU7JJJ4_9HYPH
MSTRTAAVQIRATAQEAAPKAQPSFRDASGRMEQLFGYIWRRSRKEQIRVLAVVLASLPFYYASLDIPKLIVSDAIQGRAFAGRSTATLFRLVLPWNGAVLFDGFELDRTGYLFALSAVFLLLVLVNGAFKYLINMRKGALGERVLQTLRFELFKALVTGGAEDGRRMKASEAATIIKDEVEPIGGFVGDAFIQPLFLGGQALTALAFIFVQSLALGVCAAALVAVQALIIPRMRREQLRLSRLRQLKSRALAGSIGEVVDGLDEVRNHGAAPFEISRIGARLEDLFLIRYQLYGRKFAAKFANGLLAQFTPFLFYSLGGYFALRGDLAIGQLVAVIAAYRDLPPPVKELIDWDQQRLDVEVKFQQVLEQFSTAPARQAPAAPAASAAVPPDLSAGALAVRGVTVGLPGGDRSLEGVTLDLPLGAAIALCGPPEAVSALARVIAGRTPPAAGSVTVAGRPLEALGADALGRAFAYAGPDTAVFEGSFRDNLIYALRRRPLDGAPQAEWLDYAAAGVDGPASIDGAIGRALRAVDFEADVRRMGLGARIDDAALPALAARIVAARPLVAEQLRRGGGADLIERFDLARYCGHLTIRENLLFGPWDHDEEFEPALLGLLSVELARLGLREPLEDVGLGLAATLVEIFADLGPESRLFQRFSFVSSDALDDYRRGLARARAGRRTDEDRLAQLRLALRYSEPQHRLGLLGDDLMARILAARPAMARAAAAHGFTVTPYDPAAFSRGASIRDNLLFGRVISEAPSAEERLSAALDDALAQSGLDADILAIGLDQPVGHGGRRLYPAQRAALSLARCLLKRPSVLVIDGALSVFGDVQGARILASVREAMRGRTLVVTFGPGAEARTAGFDHVVELRAGRARVRSGSAAAQASAEPPAADALSEEVRALRAVPLLASLETARLKLLAFTGQRVAFAPGDVLMRQGDEAHDALVILSGQAEVSITGDGGPLSLGLTEPNAIVGEMGALTRSRRLATVAAVTPIRALKIRRDVLLELVLDYPDFGLKLLQAQIARAAEAESLLVARTDVAIKARRRASVRPPE